MMRSVFVWFFIVPMTTGAGTQPRVNRFVRHNDKAISYEGRVQSKSAYTVLYWAGSSVRFYFNGAHAEALLKDEKGINYYYVLIDDSVRSKIKIDTVKRYYTLADHLAAGEHSIELFKCTQWDKGKTFFYGINLNGRISPDPVSRKRRRMEFYGNSITCGSAVEDSSGNDSGESRYENNYLGYASITARHYHAGYSCIARSGIGLMLSWYPLTMPEMYYRLDPSDAASAWRFSKFTPDIVVVNLLQNDAWLINRPDHEQFKIKFGTTPPTADRIIDAYRSFIRSIRTKYPAANIICVLGSMDAVAEGSPWPGYIRAAARILNDPKIFTHFFPYKNTPGHPGKKEQEAIAKSLVDFIDKNIKW